MCRENSYALMVSFRTDCCKGKRLMGSTNRLMQLGFTDVYPSGREAHQLQRWDERPGFSGFSPMLAQTFGLWYTS